jgi:hypothetical protein
MLGNSNRGKMKEMKSLKQYVQENNVISINSGGCSDITLMNKEDGRYIFLGIHYSFKYMNISSSTRIYTSPNISFYWVFKCFNNICVFQTNPIFARMLVFNYHYII